MVKCDDWTSEIQRRIKNISQIIQKRVILFLATVFNSIAFRKRRDICLFLLESDQIGTKRVRTLTSSVVPLALQLQ
jgi:hypothetical protein